MRDCLSLSASRAGWLFLICSSCTSTLDITAVAQQENTSWTARGTHASESQRLFAQSEFAPPTEAVTSSMDGAGSIYRPQIPSSSDRRSLRVRPVSVSESDALDTSVSTSPGILRSSHETLAAVPVTATISQTADSTDNTQAITQEANFYDKTRAEPLVQDSVSEATSGGDLIQIVEALQWTVAVLALAVLATLIMKKYRQPRPASGISPDIRHVATIPVKNVFQAHLLEIQGQQFLVTTDRNGVKTVTPVARWNDFESPLDNIQETLATQATGTLTS
jgi:hypothetical protein